MKILALLILTTVLTAETSFRARYGLQLATWEVDQSMEDTYLFESNKVVAEFETEKAALQRISISGKVKDVYVGMTYLFKTNAIDFNSEVEERAAKRIWGYVSKKITDRFDIRASAMKGEFDGELSLYANDIYIGKRPYTYEVEEISVDLIDISGFYGGVTYSKTREPYVFGVKTPQGKLLEARTDVGVKAETYFLQFGYDHTELIHKQERMNWFGPTGSASFRIGISDIDVDESIFENEYKGANKFLEIGLHAEAGLLYQRRFASAFNSGFQIMASYRIEAAYTSNSLGGDHNSNYLVLDRSEVLHGPCVYGAFIF